MAIYLGSKVVGLYHCGNDGISNFPTGIAVTTAPTKTSYKAGETIDLTGMVVSATYRDGTTEDITSSCTFSPAAGSTVDTSTTFIQVAWTWENQIVFCATQGITVSAGDELKLVTWAGGTDSEVAAMITAAHNGEISLKDYWAVGDTRTVSLSAGTNSAGTAIPAQDVELVLVHSPSSTSYYGGGEFIIQQKNCLTVTNYMNSSNTNSGSFSGSAMASFLNDTSTGYLSMLPSWLRNVLLTASVITAKTYNGTANQTSSHKVFLPAAKEVFGGTATSAGSSTGYSNLTEFNALEQWTYYATSANRIKQVNGSNGYWWERSPYYNTSGHFCMVQSNGVAYYNNASISYGVAPAILV